MIGDLGEGLDKWSTGVTISRSTRNSLPSISIGAEKADTDNQVAKQSSVKQLHSVREWQSIPWYHAGSAICRDSLRAGLTRSLVSP